MRRCFYLYLVFSMSFLGCNQKDVTGEKKDFKEERVNNKYYFFCDTLEFNNSRWKFSIDLPEEIFEKEVITRSNLITNSREITISFQGLNQLREDVTRERFNKISPDDSLLNVSLTLRMAEEFDYDDGYLKWLTEHMALNPEKSFSNSLPSITLMKLEQRTFMVVSDSNFFVNEGVELYSKNLNLEGFIDDSTQLIINASLFNSNSRKVSLCEMEKWLTSVKWKKI